MGFRKYVQAKKMSHIEKSWLAMVHTTDRSGRIYKKQWQEVKEQMVFRCAQDP